MIRIGADFMMLTFNMLVSTGLFKLVNFNFFTPKALPALVTFVAILDANGTDYRFNTLDSTPDLDKVIGNWNDNDSFAVEALG